MSINQIFLDISVDSCANFEIENLNLDLNYVIQNFSIIKVKTLKCEYTLHKYITKQGADFFNEDHKISLEFNIIENNVKITSYLAKTLRVNEIVFKK